jgi:hypothetical protein
MSRELKPWFRQDRNAGYVTIRGSTSICFSSFHQYLFRGQIERGCTAAQQPGRSDSRSFCPSANRKPSYYPPVETSLPDYELSPGRLRKIGNTHEESMQLSASHWLLAA